MENGLETFLTVFALLIIPILMTGASILLTLSGRFPAATRLLTIACVFLCVFLLEFWEEVDTDQEGLTFYLFLALSSLLILFNLICFVGSLGKTLGFSKDSDS